MFDCPETERAARLHSAWCDRNGVIADQPCSARSSRDGDLVTLANARGELARYRVGPSGRLHRLDA